MKYLSVCSGIEAVTVAWHDFAEPVAFCEFDQFPSAVLAHHYPDVPNLGDLTAWREWDEDLLAEVDVLVGGTPCQAFSIAGLRKSLDDDRGNLSLIFLEIADAIDDIRRDRGRPPVTILWENVPGVLSTGDNAFGCFIGGMAGSESAIVHAGRWTSAGVVDGPKRSVCWRTLDAQYFGLAQRRKRVFVVGRSGAGKHPAEILLEFEGVRRDSAPSREKGEGTATDVVPSLTASGRGVERTDESRGQDPVVVCRESGQGYWMEDDKAGTLRAEGENRPSRPSNLMVMSSGQANAEIDNDLSPSLNCNRDGAPIAFQSNGNTNDMHTLIPEVCGTLSDGAHNGGGLNGQDAYSGRIIPHVVGALTAKGPEAMGAPEVDAEHYLPIASQSNGNTDDMHCAGEGISPTVRGGGQGGNPPAVAYGIPGNWIGRKPENGGNAVEPMHDIAPNLTSTDRHGVAIGIDSQQNARYEVMGTLDTQDRGNRDAMVCFPNMQVRRLTPVECERLQGFPDNYTRIPYRNKPAEDCPDGPRYKALGNSMAVPVMRFIGRRIADG